MSHASSQLRASRHAEDRPVADMEVPFSFEELFFSRTNEKGHILAGNGVFQRVSLYSWDELLGKPHNIIRHPDMPRAVFWLLWDTIKQGRPIGAYVKNRAKDGRHYWVYAIVTPIAGGYLSVRLKPGSALFAAIQRDYASLLAAEQQGRIKPADSAQTLLRRLQELGFRDYSAFMAAALSQEIAARDRQIGRPADEAIGRFEKLAGTANSLVALAGRIFEAYSETAYVPLNLRIQAAQLGDAAATIGVISGNYSIIAEEIRLRMGEFIASAEKLLGAVHDGMFLSGTARAQQDILDFFDREDADGLGRQQAERAVLDEQCRNYRRSAADGLTAISAQIEDFHQSCTEMKRLAAGLEVTRVMGKIESSRLNADSQGLNDLIDSLEGFQGAVAEGLKEIEQMNRDIQRDIGYLTACPV